MRASSVVPRNTSVDLRSDSGRALAKGALWIIVGYVGANVFTFGLLSLFHGGGSAVSAMASLFGGAALAMFGWRRGYRIIDRIDTPEAPSAQMRSTSGLTTLIGAPEA